MNFSKLKKILGISPVSEPPTPKDILATSVKPHALMTNAEADYLLGCMPDDARDFIRKAPTSRIPGEPPEAFLTRRKFQQRLKYFIEA